MELFCWKWKKIRKKKLMASWPCYNKLFVPVPNLLQGLIKENNYNDDEMMIMTRACMKIWTKRENDWQCQEQQKTGFSKTIFTSFTKVLFGLRPIPPWKLQLIFGSPLPTKISSEPQVSNKCCSSCSPNVKQCIMWCWTCCSATCWQCSTFVHQQMSNRMYHLP